MNTFRKSVLASAVVLGLGLSASARADLIISANGTQLADDTTNTFASYTCSSTCTNFGGFNINNITATGVGATSTSGDLLDVGALDVATTNGGQLKLLVTETNLTGSGAAQFLAAFSATITNANVTRSFYIDPTNGGAEGTLLGATSGAFGASTSTSSGALSAAINLTGPFSLTEEIDIAALGNGAKLSSDDTVSVPEPAALSLMGLGLTAVAFARRRKTA